VIPLKDKNKIWAKLNNMKKKGLIDLFLTSDYSRMVIQLGYFTKDQYQKELKLMYKQKLISFCYFQWSNGFLKI